MRLLCIIFVSCITASGILTFHTVRGICPTQTFTNKTGTIDYPASAQEGDNCTFIIKVTETPGFVTLLMSDIMLTDGGMLEIFDGTFSDDTLLFSITDNSIDQTVGVTFSNNVNITYTVGEVNPLSSWKIAYTSDVCAITVDNPWSVKLEPPKYNSWPKGVRCEYKVTSTEAYDRIPVASFRLDLKGTSYLQISNGGDIKNFTAQADAEDFYPTNLTEPITVVFGTANAGESSDYSVVVDTLIQSCSQKITVNGTVQKVGLTFLETYPVLYRCRWAVKSMIPGNRILATVVTSEMPDNGDSLIFLDGGSSMVTNKALSSFHANPPVGYMVITESDFLMVMVDLGNAGGEGQLELELSTMEYGGRFEDEGDLRAGTPMLARTARSATDVSVDEPEDIVMGTESYFFQLVPSGEMQVSLNVTSPLPPNATLSIYNGLQKTDKLIALFTSVSDLYVVASGGEMLLVLEDLPTSESFSASFSSKFIGCDKLLTDTSGQLYIDEAGPHNCTLSVIPTKIAGAMLLNFDKLVVGPGASLIVSSDKGEVAQFNEAKGQASQVYLCGTSKAEVVLVAPSGEKYVSTLSGRYSVMPKACGGQLDSPSGSFKTPNFPNSYPLNAECTWTATNLSSAAATAQTFMYLNFKSMDLAPGHSINVSQMNKGSSERLANFGGQDLPDDFIVPVTQGLNVEFTAFPKDAGMSNEVGQGAEISYKLLSCGGSMTKASDKLNSPGFPKPLAKSATCLWIVQVADIPKGGDGTNIVSFSIALTDKTAKSLPESVKIYDGQSIRSQAMTVNVTKGNAKVLSRYNKVVVAFTYEDGKTKSKVGFNLTYSTYHCNSSQLCGNGICLHPEWRCNQVDDCGDFTDEKGCVPTPSPIKPTTPQGHEGYVKAGYVALLFFIALILGAVLVLVIPMIIRKVRGGPNYSRMHDNTPAVA